MMNVTLIPLLSDNYAYLLQDKSGAVAVVDPGEAGPVIAMLEQNGLGLDFILNTHHHHDHIGGNEKLRQQYGSRLAAPAADAHRIEGIDIPLSDGDTFAFGDSAAQTIATPGHTSGHIAFWFAQDAALFCGDTLFSMGCGRLFEGTAAQMWDSLSKLSALPDETAIYCGHEYTEANGRFCLRAEPDNQALKARMEEVTQRRAQGLPTIPVSLGNEKQTNCFLRAGSASRFAALREQKDRG